MVFFFNLVAKKNCFKISKYTTSLDIQLGHCKSLLVATIFVQKKHGYAKHQFPSTIYVFGKVETINKHK